ncbi:MAG: Gfo/Idh/MocA family oxidoreductase [Armatimonadetes bacterium]|nr:Gfo/Idh/MocA family oxidoreductase [Armatimonadota bacterium]
MNTPVRVGIIGMGGFAGTHHQVIRQLEASRECRLVCTCDPALSAFRQQMMAWNFAERGVRVFDGYEEMLDECEGELDLVTAPTPVPLHAAMHRACVERKLPVYLEKPPTLDIAELEEMLTVESRAARLTQVGFNFIIEKPRQAIKKRILDGEFGAVKEVCFCGLWPRPASYFTRNNWAARLMLDGRLVLDSCMGNAMAHYTHNILYWAGLKELHDWSEVGRVEAELYRGHRIEGTDTVFLKAETPGGPVIRMALTHACDGSQSHREWLVCEKATISYITYQDYTIEWADGRTESGETDRRDLLKENFRAYIHYLRRRERRPPTRLIDSRPFVQLCDLAYLASGDIATVPDEAMAVTPTAEEESEQRAIRDIQPIFTEFFASGLFPSQQGVAWARPGGSAAPEDLPRLPGVIAGMIER